MFRYLLVAFLLFITSILSAQIEDEIRSYVDSTNMIFLNGRKLIKSALKINDLDKVGEA